VRDDFGDRMKSYEAVETERRLDYRLPIYVRLDGRGFSSFTRGMDRPYDQRLSRVMIQTMRHLVTATNALVAYTQSDEISLLWMPSDNPLSRPMFDGKITKLNSVLAGLTSSAFTYYAMEDLRAYTSRIPHFDARVINIPNAEEAVNMLLWRNKDAARNAVQMVGQHHYSSKQLKGVGIPELRQMIFDIGDDFDDYPTFFRMGSYARKVLDTSRVVQYDDAPVNDLGELKRYSVKTINPLTYDFNGIRDLIFADRYQVADEVD
jgi:tRNA(His) guanylyltransferase